MKKLVKITKEVQSYEVGKTYRIHKSFADKLVRIGKAEEVVQKEEKKVLETKEEKHSPVETKVEHSTVSISKLRDLIDGLSKPELTALLKDERVSARRLAEEELKKRDQG